MTLDEIEEKIRTLCGSAPTQDGHVRGDVEAACNIALALVGHVRALRMTAGEVSGAAWGRIAALEERAKRLDALEEKVATLEDGGDGDERWGPKALDRLRAVAEERDRLRALCETLVEHQNALLAENMELLKRVAAGTWPAPQPIETAPLGEILAGPAPNGFAWAPERPLAGCSLESWRTQLREAERRWWLPMPPPGGGK